ncbi:MAG TPA: glycosyltransferase 87 family protein [Acidobacteriaceae bacterium]
MASNGVRGQEDLGFESKVSARRPLWARSWARWIELSLLAFLAVLLLQQGIGPGWRRLNTDFPNYYLVARLLREGYALDRIYDWFWLQRVKDHWGVDQSLVAFAGLTPFSAIPVLPLSFFSAIIAKRLWIVANLLFLSASIELLTRVVSLGRRRAWLLGLTALVPLCNNFRYGQMHLLVLLLIVLAYCFQRWRRPILSGICLALAGALKVYPLFFGVYFLWKKQWKNFAILICAVVALLIVGWVVFGYGVMHFYLTQALPRSLQGEMLDPYSGRASSGAAFFHRLFVFEPELNPAPSYNSPLLYAIVYPLWQLTLLLPLFAAIPEFEIGQVSGQREQLEWAAFIIVLLVLSPVPASYQFVVLIFSMVLVADVLWRRRRYGLLAIALFFYAAVSLADIRNITAGPGLSWVTFRAFGRLWLGMVLSALIVFSLWQERSFRIVAKRRLLFLMIACAAVWSVGFISYSRHFAYLATDFGRRMHMPAKTYIATPPRATDSGYLYIGVTAQGYRILNQDGRRAFAEGSLEGRVDQLSAAVAADRSVAAAELATVSTSRIVGIPLVHSGGPGGSEPGEIPSEPSVSIENAEDPALSFDGAAIAFLREERGRGSLWWTRRKTAMEPLAQPIQLVSESYDVQDVTFDSTGTLYFTARMKNKTSIYRIDESGRLALFLSGPDALRSPAFSRDGRYLAFTRLLHDRWQLELMDLKNREERSLTAGDCNAYRPAWLSSSTLAYGTDCARGLGLTAFATVTVR